MSMTYAEETLMITDLKHGHEGHEDERREHREKRFFSRITET